MKFSTFAPLAAGLLCALAMAPTLAQYKYIGPDGRVVYSDTPPPPNAKPLAKPPAQTGAAPAASGSAAGGSQSLPFALQGPTKTYPVVLYTGADCAACDQGRQLLSARGVPFAEKTVRTQDDLNAFKAATGASQIPVMLVGGSKSVGFDESAWNVALTGAGYPTNNQLPPGYKNPGPTAAAPSAKPVAVAPPPKPPAAATAGAPAGDTNQTTASQPSAPPPPTSKPPAWFKGF
ncbi:MAG: DUF4124 domain-containing protein [Burkholderiales bacterium]